MRHAVDVASINRRLHTRIKFALLDLRSYFYVSYLLQVFTVALLQFHSVPRNTERLPDHSIFCDTFHAYWLAEAPAYVSSGHGISLTTDLSHVKHICSGKNWNITARTSAAETAHSRHTGRLL
jgi:hypothetical protein